MSEVINRIAAEFAPLITAAEDAVEESMVAIANLLAGAAETRRMAGIKHADAQPAMLLLGRALTQTIETKSNVLRAHGKIEERYQIVAQDDLHPFTDEQTKRSARLAQAKLGRHLSVAS